MMSAAASVFSFFFLFSFFLFFLGLSRSSLASSAYPLKQDDKNLLISILSPGEISASSSPSASASPGFSSPFSPRSSSFSSPSSPPSMASKEAYASSSSPKKIEKKKKTRGFHHVDGAAAADPPHVIDASCLEKGDCFSSFSSFFLSRTKEERHDDASASSGVASPGVLISYRFSGAGGEAEEEKFHQEKDPLLYLFRKTDRNSDGLIDSDELLPLLNVIFKKSGKSLHKEDDSEEEEEEGLFSSFSSSSSFSSFSSTKGAEEKETLARRSAGAKLSPFSSLDRKFASEILDYFDFDADGALHEGEFFSLFTNFQSSESYMNTALYLLFLSHQYNKRLTILGREAGDLAFLHSHFSSSFSLYDEEDSKAATSSLSMKKNVNRSKGRAKKEEDEEVEEEFMLDLLQGFFPSLSLAPERKGIREEEEEELARLFHHEREDATRRRSEEDGAFRVNARKSRKDLPSIYRSKMSYKAIHTALRDIHEEQISLLKLEITQALRTHLPFLSDRSLYLLFHDSQRRLFISLPPSSSSRQSTEKHRAISLSPGAEERVRQILFPSPFKAGGHLERKQSLKTTAQEEEEKKKKAERKKEEDVIISVVLSKMKEIELFRRLLDADMNRRLHACDLDDDADDHLLDLNEVACLLEKEDFHINSSLLFSFFDKDSDRSLSIEETRNLAATITSWAVIDSSSGQSIHQGTGYLPTTGEKNVYYYQDKKSSLETMSTKKEEMKGRQEKKTRRRRREEEDNVCAFCWIVDSNKDRVVDFEEFKFFLQNENLTSVLTHQLLKKNRDIIQM